MTLKEIINRNYAATVRRGYITPETTIGDFLSKIMEEFEELQDEVDLYYYMSEDQKKLASKEMADIILVVLAMSKHHNIDIENAIIEKTLYNEKRND